MTGAEKVKQWMEKFYATNGTPNYVEIIAQLEMAIEEEKALSKYQDRPLNVLETGDYVEPHYFDTDAEASLFSSYIQYVDYTEHLEAKIKIQETFLKKAYGLIGHPCTNISASTDIACQEWRQKYEQFLI